MIPGVAQQIKRPNRRPNKGDIVRIEMLTRPLVLEAGEGLFEWRYLDDRFQFDITHVTREIKRLGGVFAQRHEQIMDRLMNMRRIYLNLHTGEVSS